MQMTFEKIVCGILIVVVLFLGFVFLGQQKAINQIRSQISNNGTVPSNGSANLPFDDGGAMDVDSQSHFNGEIKAVSGSNLDVEAVLYIPKDPEKIKAQQEKIKSGQAATISSDDYQTTKKVIKVLLNDSTQYFDLKQEDIRVGDKVFVTANDSPYKKDSLTAVKIARLKQ